MRRVFLLILLTVASVPALAFWQSRDSNYNISIGGAASTFLTAPILIPASNATGGAAFYQVAGGSPLAGNTGASAALVDIPVSTSGTISNFCITSSFTGTGSNYWNYAVTYDDVDQTLAVNTLSITAGTPVCDTTVGHNVSYAAGHKLTIHKTATGAPTNDTVQYSFLMTDASGQFGTIFIAPSSVATTVGTAQYIGYGNAFNATENIVSMYFPVAGHIDNLYTNVTAATAAQFWTFTVQHDTHTTTDCDTNASTTLVTTYASGASGILSDLTAGHGFDVAAGDCISVQTLGSTGVMTSTHLFASVRWTPIPPTGNYIYPEMAGGTTMATVASARWLAIPGTQQLNTSSTESLAYVLVPTLGSFTMTVANLSSLQSTTIGTTKNWTLRAGTGTQASVSPTCSSTTATVGCLTGNSVGSTSVTANNWLDWQVTPTGTATATAWHKESYTANVH
jgi:hypothetical protein